MQTIETLKSLSKEDMAALILKMQAEAPQTKLTVKHNPETGTVSVYGLNARFPVSLYPTQWERLLTDPCIAAVRAACKVAAPIAAARKAAKAA